MQSSVAAKRRRTLAGNAMTMLGSWAAATVLAGEILLTATFAGSSIAAASENSEKIQAESPLWDAMHTSRNEDSTPRDAILPVSPAIAGSNQEPASSKEIALILRSKAFLLRLGYEVGRLDGRITAKYKAAIFRYQRAHGIPASGELDDATLGKLGIATQ